MDLDRTCIYCDKALDNSKEHILQEGFGTTLSSREIVCSQCNTLFATTIDKICTDQNALFCNQAGISGKPKKGRKKGDGKRVIVHNSENKKFIIDGHQKIKENKKTQVDKIHDENGNLAALKIKGYEYKATQNIIKSLKKKYPFKDPIMEDEILPSDQYKFVLTYDNSYFKGIKKSIVNFLAYMEPDIARSSALKNARSDIYNSSKNVELGKKDPAPSEPVFPLSAIDEKNIPSDALPSDITGIYHTIIISLNPKDKSIIGILILFSSIIHTFILSDNYKGRAATYTYNCLPLEVGSKRTKTKHFDKAILNLSNISYHTDNEYINKKLKLYMKKLSGLLANSARNLYFKSRISNFFDIYPVPNGTVNENLVEIEKAFFRILTDFAYSIHFDAVVTSDVVNDFLETTSSAIVHTMPQEILHKKVSEMQEEFGLLSFDLFKKIEPLIRTLLLDSYQNKTKE